MGKSTWTPYNNNAERQNPIVLLYLDIIKAIQIEEEFNFIVLYTMWICGMDMYDT